MIEKNVKEAIQHRRSVRIFDADKEIYSVKVKNCIQNAVLAPTSSNMQLWEFYHITDSNVLEQLTNTI